LAGHVHVKKMAKNMRNEAAPSTANQKRRRSCLTVIASAMMAIRAAICTAPHNAHPAVDLLNNQIGIPGKVQLVGHFEQMGA
jgi:hypothetical protein